MKKTSIQTQIKITQSKTALEERAQKMSWNHTYTPDSIADEEALVRELAFMSDQESLFAKFTTLYSQSPPPPLWVEEELQFPLPQVWIEEARRPYRIRSKMADCHRRENPSPSKKKQRNLPPIPKIFTQKSIAPLLQAIKKQQSLGFLSTLQKLITTPFSTPSWSAKRATLQTYSMVYIPPRFKDPLQNQTFLPAFWMGMYPCTQELYQAVMGNNPSAFIHPHHPVECISWCMALIFCNRLSTLEGYQPAYTLREDTTFDMEWVRAVRWNKNANGYRLPTFDEWHHASQYEALMSELESYAWLRTNSGHETQPVGKKQPNPFGLYDVLGNVYAWVWDHVPNHDHRMACGLSFGVFLDLPKVTPKLEQPWESYNTLGFRLVRNHVLSS